MTTDGQTSLPQKFNGDGARSAPEIIDEGGYIIVRPVTQSEPSLDNHAGEADLLP